MLTSMRNDSLSLLAMRRRRCGIACGMDFSRLAVNVIQPSLRHSVAAILSETFFGKIILDRHEQADRPSSVHLVNQSRNMGTHIAF